MLGIIHHLNRALLYNRDHPTKRAPLRVQYMPPDAPRPCNTHLKRLRAQDRRVHLLSHGVTIRSFGVDLSPGFVLLHL